MSYSLGLLAALEFLKIPSNQSSPLRGLPFKTPGRRDSIRQQVVSALLVSPELQWEHGGHKGSQQVRSGAAFQRAGQQQIGRG